MCLCMCESMCTRTHVEVRGQRVGVESLLPPCGPWRLNIVIRLVADDFTHRPISRINMEKMFLKAGSQYEALASLELFM